jgi:hypothetical protein
LTLAVADVPGLERDQSTYSPRWIAFVRQHEEEYRTAYEAIPQATSRALLERLHREWATLPPRHLCSCHCPNQARGFPPCRECARLRASSVRDDMAGEVRGTGVVDEGVVPMPLMLDLERALSVLGELAGASVIARFLSEGNSG